MSGQAIFSALTAEAGVREPVRDLPGEKAIALIRFYDPLNEISKHVDDWWEREGQLAVNIFNVLMQAAERSLRLGSDRVREFDLDECFPPPYESWGTLTTRIERSLDSSAKAFSTTWIGRNGAAWTR